MKVMKQEQYRSDAPVGAYNLASLLAPITAAQFLETYWQHKQLYVPGYAGKFADLFSYDICLRRGLDEAARVFRRFGDVLGRSRTSLGRSHCRTQAADRSGYHRPLPGLINYKELRRGCRSPISAYLQIKSGLEFNL